VRAHDHDGHDADQHERGRLWHRLEHVFRPHSHDSTDKVDAALESSNAGMRALWISLLILGITVGLQAVVAVWSGFVALSATPCTTSPTR
jgi:hypothetical protein